MKDMHPLKYKPCKIIHPELVSRIVFHFWKPRLTKPSPGHLQHHLKLPFQILLNLKLQTTSNTTNKTTQTSLV